MKIEKIQTKDIKKAHDFCIGIWDEFGWDKRFAEGFKNLKKYFGGKREAFFLGREGKNIIASAGLKELSEEKALMMRFYVASEFRGRGVAFRMLDNIKKFAKRNNYKYIVLDTFKTNFRAKKFYKKQGFKVFYPKPERFEKWTDAKHPDFFDFRILKL
jgi:ribosomal protein S18 acetylase RimI-like enzyme